MDEEVKMLLNAILERVKTKDAKIDALTLDVRKLQGDVESLKEIVAVIDKRLDHLFLPASGRQPPV
jgi:outer membrane murein-binding lipoprotein Lpp